MRAVEDYKGRGGGERRLRREILQHNLTHLTPTPIPWAPAGSLAPFSLLTNGELENPPGHCAILPNHPSRSPPLVLFSDPSSPQIAWESFLLETFSNHFPFPPAQPRQGEERTLEKAPPATPSGRGLALRGGSPLPTSAQRPVLGGGGAAPSSRL